VSEPSWKSKCQDIAQELAEAVIKSYNTHDVVPPPEIALQLAMVHALLAISAGDE